MKKGKNLYFIFLGILIGICIITFLSFNLSQIHYSLQFKVNGYTEANALAICSNKNLEKTSECLNSFVRGVYSYVPTSDSERLDFNKIIEEGNDCRGYNFIYETLFHNLGIKTKKVIIDVSREDNIQYKHVFLIAYDENSYTLLDQRRIFVFKYER